jgi:EAL domain-containing protein (putative c-di-GMP-specific phosphodiesterase class I)
MLVVEVTETSLVLDTPAVREVVTGLHRLGVSLSIDDFGTGYSSLSYLKHVPAAEIKIDRRFITDLIRDRDDVAIVRSVIELAHTTRRRVVAEGVEDEATLALLTRLGCDAAQGFHLSKPLPAAELLPWLRGAPRPASVPPAPGEAPGTQTDEATLLLDSPAEVPPLRLPFASSQGEEA